MYIPCIQKVSYKNNAFIERALPGKGTLRINIGDQVKSFTELGQSASKTVLAGVWGNVEDIVPEYSALIRTSVVDLHLPISSVPYVEGELIVFPNPSDLIQKQYFDKFSYSLKGKIVYTGNNISPDILKTAQKYGVAGVLTGGCNRRTFDYARSTNFFLGLFSGFGNARTPDIIFDVLNDLSTRMVFASGEERWVRIPVPSDFVFPSNLEESPEVFKDVRRGLRVLVLQTPWFGETGHVLDINANTVTVKLSGIGSTVEVNIPNLFALR
jgi:hypothetical protein